MKKVLFILVAFLVTGSTLFSQISRSHSKCSTPMGDVMLKGVDTSKGRNVANNYVLWDNGTVIAVKFLPGGSKTLRDKVMQYAKEWEQFANVKFNFVADNAPVTNIRVLLGDGYGHNSQLGTNSNNVTQTRQTLNLDTIDFVDIDYYIDVMKRRGISPNWEDLRKILNESSTIQWNSRGMRGTVLHEFGHALGLLHEQSYPGAIKWNKDTVYKHYLKTQKWDKETVDFNVLMTYDKFYTNGTQYDPRSIMHYSVEAWETLDGYYLDDNYDLSSGDKGLIAALYPKDKAVSDRDVPRVEVKDFKKLDIKHSDVKPGLTIYPSFDLKMNSKVGNVWIVAKLIDENDYYIKDNNDNYNWGGHVAGYTKLTLLPNSKTSYNKDSKNLEIYIPYSEIPLPKDKKVTVELRVVLEDVINGNLVKVTSYFSDTPVSLTK